MAEQKRFIGVDLSKRSFEVAMVSGGTSQIIRKKYKATTEGLKEFVASLRKDDVIAMETGRSSFVLAKLIQKRIGRSVYVLNADKLYIIFNSLRKTDKEDALRIACMHSILMKSKRSKKRYYGSTKKRQRYP